MAIDIHNGPVALQAEEDRGCGRWRSTPLLDEKEQSTLLSTAEAPYFDEYHPFVATCVCVCLFGHVFTCFPVGVACGVVAVVRAMWFVQCAVSARARCHMCAAKQWSCSCLFVLCHGCVILGQTR